MIVRTISHAGFVINVVMIYYVGKQLKNLITCQIWDKKIEDHDFRRNIKTKHQDPNIENFKCHNKIVLRPNENHRF